MFGEPWRTFFSKSYRRDRHSADFNETGDIHTTRTNEDPAPVIYSSGLPLLPIYKGYYTLAGRRGANLLGENRRCIVWATLPTYEKPGVRPSAGRKSRTERKTLHLGLTLT